MPRRKTTSIAGTATGTTRFVMLRRGAGLMTITSVPKISTPMATGRAFLITDRYGFRLLHLAGRHTATAAGCGSRTGDGPGFPMSPGAGRRITTVAGSGTEVRGFGGQDRCTAITTIVRSGRLLMCRSSVSAAQQGSAWALAGVRSVGCQWDHVMDFIRGGEVTGRTLTS